MILCRFCNKKFCHVLGGVDNVNNAIQHAAQHFVGFSVSTTEEKSQQQSAAEFVVKRRKVLDRHVKMWFHLASGLCGGVRSYGF